MTKRALCIGINYVGTSSQLAGCVNDANDWAAALRNRGFQVEDMLDAEATRGNMLASMAGLIEETGPDDLAVITYSGLPPAEWIDDEDRLFEARLVANTPARGKPRSSALLLAACSDVEVAYDAWFSGRANGAFTYAALQALAENPATYRDWQQGIRALLPSVDYQQTPQLTAGSGQRRWLTFEETGER